jgi:phospholipid-binding lipoprotein MlaA
MRHLLTMALLGACLAGCASRNPDPYEGVNRKIDNVNNAIDRAVVRDVARAYEKNVPEPVRDGVDNFFNNLGYLNVILNDHLQGRFAQGWRNTGRMAMNTLVGVGGVFDVAERNGLPRERNDFGITLGKWGVRSGPYLVLPLLGPSSARDVPGLVVARVTNPMFWLNPPMEVSLPATALSVVDQRARLQPQIEVRDRAALDPYTFTRDVYLKWRSAQVGENTADERDPFEEEEPLQSTPNATDYLR